MSHQVNYQMLTIKRSRRLLRSTEAPEQLEGMGLALMGKRAYDPSITRKIILGMVHSYGNQIQYSLLIYKLYLIYILQFNIVKHV